MRRVPSLLAISLLLIISASPAEFSSIDKIAARGRSTSELVAGMLARAPAPTSAGAALATPMSVVGAPEDLVFGFRGGDTKDFWKYSISQNQWTAAPDAPAAVGDGAALVTIFTSGSCSPGGPFCIAALRGGNTTDFWIFDIQANKWCSGPNIPGAVGAGGAIAQLQRIGHT